MSDNYNNRYTEQRDQRDQRPGPALGPDGRPKRPHDPTDNNWRGYRNSYAIYPDYWKKSWGPMPLLGYVKADSAFNAKYVAFDKGLVYPNNTFGPDPIMQIRRPYTPRPGMDQQG